VVPSRYRALVLVAGKFIVSPPKTAAGQRVVVLPAVALAALAEHLDSYAAPEPDGLVFPSGRGTYLQCSNSSRLVWRPAVQRLGLDGLRFHDLRHTAATLAAAAGAALPARDGQPSARHRRRAGWAGPRCQQGAKAPTEGA
jgi:integrase